MAAPMVDSSVEIRVDTTSGKGRALFALRDIKQDEALIEEEPLVSAQFSWNSLYKYTACDFCMRSLETAEAMAQRLTNNATIVLPHPECCQVHKAEHVQCPHCQILYCSSDCQQKAWNSYHKCLCTRTPHMNPEHPVNKLDEIWRNMHYPPETATIMLVVRMIAKVRQASDKQNMKDLFKSFCQRTVNEEEEIAHKLLGKEFQSQLEMLRAHLCEALYDEDIQQWFTPEGFRSIFALIGTNGQGIGSSSIGTWAKNCESLQVPEDEKTSLDLFIDQLYEELDNTAGPFLNCEGSGLYTTQSSCNHSCVPNAEVTFPHCDFRLSLMALRDITAGEEITISYLDECDQGRSRHSRQKTLRENYLFNCECEKCLSQADDEDVTSDEEDDDDMDES